jgi:hypothetical protein
MSFELREILAEIVELSVVEEWFWHRQTEALNGRSVFNRTYSVEMEEIKRQMNALAIKFCSDKEGEKLARRDVVFGSYSVLFHGVPGSENFGFEVARVNRFE